MIERRTVEARTLIVRIQQYTVRIIDRMCKKFFTNHNHLVILRTGYDSIIVVVAVVDAVPMTDGGDRTKVDRRTTIPPALVCTNHFFSPTTPVLYVVVKIRI